ncbi:hypothetical protein SAMN05444274_10221 [Mariniphaga anaerophila]|uniref:Uncharacterized protein n=1 Tax=Mariniphaga anaerophila TaxID=1484053 RepID=A0A1M4V8F3_9BACT|nr:hypothetical protein SAMN05444274_10221 [Mariniphaga anaerophila]
MTELIKIIERRRYLICDSESFFEMEAINVINRVL